MRYLLFDLFGVIACHQPPSGIAEIERVAGIPAAELWEAYWALRQPYDRGDQDGPAYWRAIAARLDRTFDGDRIAALIAADLRSWREVDQAMVDYVGELAESSGSTLGLLSNIPVELADDIERRHRWLDRFRVRAFSCRIGHAKPESGAYEWCLRAFGCAPSEVLFIDDREENVAAARRAGMHGHRFTSRTALRALLSDGSAVRPAGERFGGTDSVRSAPGEAGQQGGGDADHHDGREHQHAEVQAEPGRGADQ